ncbi:MAG: hypothetical protein J0M33_26255 [Anaerolineae bacterium]|nr:hypothetical protein [Anaerolineae bacterium]
MSMNEPNSPIRFRIDEAWMPERGHGLDADLVDDGGIDEPDPPARYWTLRRVIWIVMALLALIALLASVIAPLLVQRPGLPQPPPDTRDMVEFFMNGMV